MKKWQCQVCEKEDCWGLFEVNRGPAMCRECWETMQAMRMKICQVELAECSGCKICGKKGQKQKVNMVGYIEPF